MLSLAKEWEVQDRGWLGQGEGEGTWRLPGLQLSWDLKLNLISDFPKARGPSGFWPMGFSSPFLLEALGERQLSFAGPVMFSKAVSAWKCNTEYMVWYRFIEAEWTKLLFFCLSAVGTDLLRGLWFPSHIGSRWQGLYVPICMAQLDPSAPHKQMIAWRAAPERLQLCSIFCQPNLDPKPALLPVSEHREQLGSQHSHPAQRSPFKAAAKDFLLWLHLWAASFQGGQMGAGSSLLPANTSNWKLFF